MGDIHNPSVPSATAGPNGESKSDDSKPLMELIADKDRVESELTALGSVLDSVGSRTDPDARTVVADGMLAWSEHEYNTHYVRWLPARRYRHCSEYVLSQTLSDRRY